MEKFCRELNHWDVLNTLGYLLILQIFSSVIRPSVFANWHPPKFDRIGIISSLMITFPKDSSQVLEKDMPGL